jgi:hypothetical protein
VRRTLSFPRLGHSLLGLGRKRSQKGALSPGVTDVVVPDGPNRCGQVLQVLQGHQISPNLAQHVKDMVISRLLERARSPTKKTKMMYRAESLSVSQTTLHVIDSIQRAV